MLHDIGKVSAAFQRYISDNGPSPDHSTAGAVEAARYGPVWGRLIALAVAGHHAGLPDADAAFAARLAKDLPDYAGWEAQVPGLPARVETKLGRSTAPGYSLAFLGRMIFSCLVDADFPETERFYAEQDRGGHTPLSVLRDRLDSHMARFADGPRAKERINVLRGEILAHARAEAACAPGLFTMTVPTGGGKTLASLAFALDHAVTHSLERVIFVIPYTSMPTAATRKLRRASENWDVPIVVTTAVQFFESLHANRTGACHKLHNLARSVIILDEAQTLPVPCCALVSRRSASCLPTTAPASCCARRRSRPCGRPTASPTGWRSRPIANSRPIRRRSTRNRSASRSSMSAPAPTPRSPRASPNSRRCCASSTAASTPGFSTRTSRTGTTRATLPL